MMSNYNPGMDTLDAISLISRIREQVNRFITAEMEKHGVEGIVTSHGDIIYALFKHAKLSMADIARKVGKDKSTITALVDKLVRYGYVTKERDRADSRVVYVSLTARGRELEPVFEAISSELLNAFYRNVSEEEKELLFDILKRIHQNF